MTSAQTTLKNQAEYCEHSEPLGSYFRCKLTDFGFVFRCTLEDRARCPDLEYFKNREKKQEAKRK